MILPNSDSVLENLREIDFYDWEGKDKNELQLKFPESWEGWKEGSPDKLIVLDTRNKNDDSSFFERYPLLELWNRAHRVWDEIFEHQQQQLSSMDHEEEEEEVDITVLIVAHGSLGQALLGTAMGWDANHFRNHEFPNCGMVEIEFLNYNNDNDPRRRRPKVADRWRWKWPIPSLEWNYYSEPSKDPATCQQQD